MDTLGLWWTTAACFKTETKVEAIYISSQLICYMAFEKARETIVSKNRWSHEAINGGPHIPDSCPRCLVEEGGNALRLGSDLVLEFGGIPIVLYGYFVPENEAVFPNKRREFQRNTRVFFWMISIKTKKRVKQSRQTIKNLLDRFKRPSSSMDSRKVVE